MATLNLKSLVSKLNTTCQRSLEASAGMCLSRSHYNIEIEHWLIKLLEENANDISLIFKHYDLDKEAVMEDLQASLNLLKTGNVRPPALSQNIVDLCREAWLLASLEYNVAQTRSGYLLIALLQETTLARFVHSLSKQFKKIPLEILFSEFSQIVADSLESSFANHMIQENSTNTSASQGKTPSLNQFTIDLTEQARQGHIDPVLGRENEVRQIIDILMRRRQNNPILTGEAGVGKTAVVEGFALRVAKGEVPPSLQNISIRQLDLGLLQAGAGIKGEFENRLKSVINEVKTSVQPIILFIDEAHTLIGAGGQAGQGDAANLLKPELARGGLRTIAATTWSEYKKYFEQDPALTRRFQVVKVEEPDEDQAIGMLQGMIATLEKHHNVRILNEAIVEAVRLSSRYIASRQLPDKAVSLLDTACAKVAIGHNATPAALEDCQYRIKELQTAKGILVRDMDTGISHEGEITQLDKDLEKLEEKRLQLDQQWTDEKKCINEIHAIFDKIEGKESDQEKSSLQQQLAELASQLAALQGEHPLMQPWVDGQAVATIVGNWTGIPVGRMLSNEIHTILTIQENLQKRIIGQTHALQGIAEIIKTSRAKMTDPRKPIGVFLFVGPSGVGKTETALALAELLYGGQQNLTIINMSEFKEEHKVSTLVGAPPGYVGYGQGGVLTEAVRRRPYSLILFDEMEKAHPGVQDVFYQVFDKGMLRDSEGRDIDFKNTAIIMTSNAASDMISKLCADMETLPDPDALTEMLQPELLKIFKPAFLGRVKIIPYYPLTDANMKMIIELQLSRIRKRIMANYQAEFNYSLEVVDYINERCNQTETGARTIEHLLNGSILPKLSEKFLMSMVEEQKVKSVKVEVVDSQFKYIVQ